MKLKTISVFVIAGAITLATISWPRVDAHTRISTDVTWGNDIRAILEEKCMRCHHPGGIAPDYADFTIYGTDTKPGARAQSTYIEEMIVTGRMPPWGPDERFGNFQNSPLLTEEEKEYVLAWVQGGAPKGYQPEQPVPDRFLEYTWELGMPDLVFSLPQGHVVPADQQHDRTSHVFDVEIEEDTYITAFEFLVNNPRNVYRMEAWLHDPEGFEPDPIEVEMQVEYDPLADEDAPEPTRMRDMPKGSHYIGQWARGDMPVIFPDEAGRLLRKGSKLELHIEYRRPDFADWSEPVRDNSKLGLFLAQPDEIIDLLVESVEIANKDFVIKANKSDQVVKTSYTTTENVHLLGVDPALGVLGKKLRVQATYPDGLIKTLMYIPKYSFRFPSSFIFAEPIPAPEGTVIEIVGHYDNSADNWDNPNDPPADVRAGSGFEKERLQAVLTYTLDDHLKVDEPFVPKPETAPRGGGMLAGANLFPDGTPGLPAPDPQDEPPVMTFSEDEDTGAEANRIVLAKNNFHHVEGVLHRPGAFQLFVYDSSLSPIDPRNFTGTVKVNDGAGEIPLVYALPGDDHLSAWVPPKLPLRVEATVDIGGTPETFVYEFEGETAGEDGTTPARPFKAPLHEGLIHVVPDFPYRIEGTMTEAGVLRIYFYTEEMTPIDPRNFGGHVTVGRDSDKATALTYQEQGDDFLVASVPKSLPLELYVTIPFGNESKRFRFTFEELTEEPWDDWGEEEVAATPAAVGVGKHGGPRYYKSKNGFHTVEATVPRPGELRVYVYDEWKNEVSPALFSGTATGTVAGKAQEIELEAYAEDLFLSGYFTPAFPVSVDANITLTGQEETFEFAFEETTVDPTVPEVRTAHMDHTPVHGGHFFMADNLYHHIEGTMPRPGELRVYFYDDFKRPLHPLSFGGKAYIDRENPDTGEVTATPYDLVHARETDDYLMASVPPEMPMQLYVEVMMGGDLKRYDFLFEELTQAPLTIRTTLSPPTVSGEDNIDAEHSHQRDPMIIPNNSEDILEMITQRQIVLENMIAAKDFKNLYRPSWDIADLVAALADRGEGLSVRQKGGLTKLVAQLNISWRKIDRAGDTGDAPRVDAEYAKFAKSIEDVQKIFGK